ncbi:DUF6484 domain-containing protein [Teredinibacter turnerae]|uniref:DUF6484 domain-containing protein n=1 Tax=Teredinibacter turnerae (strain ATCC 39867 / T7901) TaxID=377629 RepID=C5BTZ0_TERTT|nr:DUF6484 domain-containing protein [Teredinibacter turnerae]ACR14380.1 conserved hypothetical protein [Teredinibacter turnerae T7901]
MTNFFSKDTDETSSNEVFQSTVQNLGLGEVVLGTYVGAGRDGHPEVAFEVDGFAFQQTSKSTVALEPKDIGRQVVLMFLQDSDRQPVITGIVHNNLDAVLAFVGPDEDTLSPRNYPLSPVGGQGELQVDGEAVEKRLIEGQDEVVLKCGEASITLTKSGKIVLRGKYILSRSSGVQRILGASVQVN